MIRHFWAWIGIGLYWLLLPAIWLYAKITKPRARVLLIHGDQVLVVKNWLSAGVWALPGGGLEGAEMAIDAAVREVSEELGIAIVPKQLLPLGEYRAVEPGYLVSKYYLFAAELSEKPSLRLAQTEIMAADWMDMQQLTTAKKGVGTTVKQSIAVWMNR